MMAWKPAFPIILALATALAFGCGFSPEPGVAPSDVMTKDIPAPEPTHTPAPSATPEPTHTPAPSATPEPTRTPAPSTPEPTRTPMYIETAKYDLSVEAPTTRCGGPHVGHVRHTGYPYSPPGTALKWTPDGTRVLFSYIDALYIVGADGAGLRKVADIGRPLPHSNDMVDGVYADISPDGSRVVFTTCKYPYTVKTSKFRSDYFVHHYEIAIANLDGSNEVRLTENDAHDHYPVWSPDGSRIAFFSDLREQVGLFTMNPDGTDVRDAAPWFHGGPYDAKRRYFNTDRLEVSFHPPRWSPDGERIAFAGRSEGESDPSRSPIFIVTEDGRSLRAIVSSRGAPSWSPDGQRLAFIVGQKLHSVLVDGSDIHVIADLSSEPVFEYTMGISWSPDVSAFIINITNPYQMYPEVARMMVVKDDGDILMTKPLSYGEWSPDGKRVAVKQWAGWQTRRVPKGQALLYTVAPDGSDRRDLVAIGDNGEPKAANPK